MLWGANVLSTHPHLWRPILEARRHGACIVAIDPIRTRTAAQCDWHLAPMPGTDAALALGLLHVVLAEGREDREFIDRATVGWEAFRRRILEFPPARVADDHRAPGRDSIVELGKRLAETRPTGIRIGIGIQRHGGGGMAVRTITVHPRRHRRLAPSRRRRLLRHARLLRPRLGGAVARRPAAPARARAAHDAARRGTARASTIRRSRRCSCTRAIPRRASRIRRRSVRGLARDDLFTVVVEHFLTDTARYADIVLPATMQIEHQDLLIAYGHLYLAWNEPAVAPPGECLPTTEIFRRLARQMGLDDAGAVRQRRDDGAAAPGQRASLARRHHARGAEGPRLDAAQLSRSVRAVRDRVSDRVGQAGVRLRPHGAGRARSGRRLHARRTRRRSEAPRSPASTRLRCVTPADHYFLNSIFANVPRAAAARRAWRRC